MPLALACRAVHTLPNELVGEVFAIWLIISKDSDAGTGKNVRFIASAVCSRWRAIALATPTLWADVVLRLHAANQWRDTSWLQYLKCLRERGGAVPLKLVLHMSADFDIQPALWDELGLLFKKSQSVDVHNGKHAQLILRLWSADFPLLQHLRISSPRNAHALQYPVAERAPHLDSLALDCVHWPWSATAELPHLNTLECCTTSSVHVSDLALAFAKLPGLKKLSLQANNVDLPSATHAVPATNTRELDLASSLQVARFDLDYANDHWQTTQTFLRNLPSPHLLVSLDVWRAFLDCTSLHGLRAVPNLQELVLRDCRLRPNCGDIFETLKDNYKLTRLHITWDMERFDRSEFDLSASTLLELVRVRRNPSRGRPYQRIEVLYGACYDEEFNRRLFDAMFE